MDRTKQIILGILLIIAAVAGAAIAILDSDPKTNPDIPAVVGAVQDGAGLIRGDDSGEPVSTIGSGN